MSLWINGKWLIGEGPRRQRANPVSGETVWQGHDASALQVNPCRGRGLGTPFRHGRSARSANVSKLLKRLPVC